MTAFELKQRYDPVPVRDFTARLTVTAVGSDHSEIHWATQFEPAPGALVEAHQGAPGVFFGDRRCS
ncbi:hypothetical protein ACFXKC_50810 [Streptomyces sp. NPDC059340]|uniref:hypothetical protein n=1 Tax=Streptomyces sp. NPDC059340 TaxID=3346806 RepID=UPI00367FE954